MTTYDNAPLTEVVISAAIPPMLELMPQHVGLLWAQLRAEFPSCQQHPTVGLPAEAPGDFFPLPRFWFISADDSEVLQLQRDRFTVNWRHRDGLEYPRFGAVKQRFASYHASLRAFAAAELQTELPPIVAQEVTYINTLNPSLGWRGMESLSKVLPSFSPPTLSEAQKLSGINIMLAAADGGSDDSIGITCKNGIAQNNGDPILILEIKVGTKDVERTPEEALAWIDGAHECVIKTFNALTSEEIQTNVWLKVKNV